MNNTSKRRLIWSIIVGIGVILGIIVYLLNIYQFIIPRIPFGSDNKAPSTPNAVSSQGANTQIPTTGFGSVSSVLTPQEVQTWCSVIPNGGTCDISRFEQLPLGNGAVDPNAVHMKTGYPVEIKIPQGFSAYIWDCFKGFDVTGLKDEPKVCEMRVKRL
ncbi:MAG TPA: hypothetical protein VEP90_00185 [Methylomirabilota bacterium]|nr:hypothetical protein [Methylomirabilota bacterium]